MRKNFLWIMATAIIFTSSCAKAPEEVKKENDILNNTEKAESAELEYQTLDEIRKTSADTLATNTTNVTVNKLIIGNGDVMPAYKVLPYNNNFDLLKPLVKYLYNEEFSLDSPYCEYNIGGQKYNEDDPESDINPHSSIMYAGESMDFTRSLIYHETGYSFYNAVSGDDPAGVARTVAGTARLPLRTAAARPLWQWNRPHPLPRPGVGDIEGRKNTLKTATALLRHVSRGPDW